MRVGEIGCPMVTLKPLPGPFVARRRSGPPLEGMGMRALLSFLIGCAIAGLVGFSVRAAPPPANYQGLWWNSPPQSESGWGINVAHQGDKIFATWFTYDTAGDGWWLSMTADKTAEGIYS